MLAKKDRLPVQEALTRTGRTVRRPAFTVKIFPALSSHSRFGVVVGRRVGKTAVLRNMIRRRAFNAIWVKKLEWPLADYLVITHPAAAVYTAHQWYEELIPSSITRPTS
jgi:ribonuclease P protein component